MEKIMSQLNEILEQMHPEVDFEMEKALVDDGILDSFDIVALVTDISDEFDINISAAHLIPQNFNTLEAMAELVDKLLNE